MCAVLACLPAVAARAQANVGIEKVYVIFKTHLDIGFTDLSSVVEEQYVNEFIPKALAVADELRAAGGEERYVWTTGAWLVSAYLEKAAPDQRARLEEAIRRGDIVWNGVPYTVESEIMTSEMFAEMLRLAGELDRKYGKRTIAAKMTDVPGHTRGIIPLLRDAGFGLLHIGVNAACAVPEVPPISRWVHPDGSSIVLMYELGYGNDFILPSGRTAVSINFTGDNHGPHTVEQVREIYRELHRRYPNAELVASTLNDVAEDVLPYADGLPEVTDEIGDTWIYGYASAPLRIAKYRKLSRMYNDWVADGRLDPASPEALDFVIRLSMVAEHTWGLDVKTHLLNWDKYNYEDFTAARSLPAFRRMEASWAEKDANIDKAIALLPEPLRAEASREVELLDRMPAYDVARHDWPRGLDRHGALRLKAGGVDMLAGLLTYQSFSQADYEHFWTTYLIPDPPQWGIEDNGKPGLEKSRAQSATLAAEVRACEETKTSAGSRIVCELGFPADARVDARFLPARCFVEYNVARDGRSAEISLTIPDKPANRMPEAYWLTFRPERITSILVEKMGLPTDVLDVVEGGNRRMHAADNYVDIVTQRGTVRITTLDAPLVGVGRRGGLNFSREQPDLSEGVHFCLYNNLWGTNFAMWFEGSVNYRFRVEIL